MAAVPPRARPAYAVKSVDNALRLLQMLRDLGEVRVKEAADELGISPSTVHRLMAMLVFRGFAVQNASRVYLPGPSVGVPPVVEENAKELQEIVRPHLERLRDATQANCHFMILTGRAVRFLLTVESAYPAQAGDRHGFVIPAHSSVGGRAILSCLGEEEFAHIISGSEAGDRIDLDERALQALRKDLLKVRDRGYAVGVGAVEKGIAAMAAPIRHPWVRPRSAISISTNAAHGQHVTEPDVIGRVLQTRAEIESAIVRRTTRRDRASQV